VLLAGCHHSTSSTAVDAGQDLAAADLAAGDLATSPTSAFPAAPQVDPGLPADIASQFTTAPDAGSAAPCLVEPMTGALVPKNWSPLYAEWTAASGQNVFELRVHVANQPNDLVVYTSATTYSMDAATWSALVAQSDDLDVAISLRAAQLSGTSLAGAPTQSATSTVHLAPAAAPGNIVYWSGSTTTSLLGFAPGATTSKTVLTPTLMNDGTQCIGCHSATPDGKLVSVSRSSSSSGGAYSVDLRSGDGTGTKASDVATGAFTDLARTVQTMTTYSKAHYIDGDRVALGVLSSTDTSNASALVWTDLESTSTAEGAGWGRIARTGDLQQATTPTWSHDGNTIVYTSSTDVDNGTTGTANTDLFAVPYNNRAGGTATPIAGASAADENEYYPAFSPDDTMIAFDQTSLNEATYNGSTAELHVIPAAGGTSRRLAANDPPVCTGLVSPGIANAWPHWAPGVVTVGTKSYYWLVFSSRRLASTTLVYISALVVDSSNGQITDYPALYVTAQSRTVQNHTPQWDVFELP
jgi:hypothetical protein